MMKKITSILLGLILAASFLLTGCQSGTEPEADTGDTGSSAAIASSAALSEKDESANSDEKADESASASGTETEAGGSQTENEVETNQPEQTAGDLKITAEGVPVEVRLASDGQCSYEYDKDEYAVTTATNGSTFEIKVTDITPEIDSGGNVVVYIPDQSYTLITGVSTGSSLVLPAINANLTVTSNASSVVLNLPSDYDKTLSFTGNASSCTLSMSGIDDFAVSAKISTSTVAVPNGWPVYDMLSSNYYYASGDGTEEMQQPAETQVIGDPAEEETDDLAETIKIMSEILEVDWSDYFDGRNGTAVVYDPTSQKYTIYNHDLAVTRSSPCSTFKIISSLIALENGIFEPENSTRTWSGEIFWNEDWNKNIDFQEAFRTSCVWYYRQVIDDIGEDLMQRELDRLQYGNCDISDWEGRLNTNNNNRDLTGFWIESSLKISPKEQVEVMERIFGPDSDYSKEAQNELKQVMLVPETDSTNVSIYGKTGMGKSDGIVVDAWFTGLAEHTTGEIYFCVRLGRTDGMNVSSSLAKEIAIKIVSDY